MIWYVAASLPVEELPSAGRPHQNAHLDPVVGQIDVLPVGTGDPLAAEQADGAPAERVPDRRDLALVQPAAQARDGGLDLVEVVEDVPQVPGARLQEERSLGVVPQPQRHRVEVRRLDDHEPVGGPEVGERPVAVHRREEVRVPVAVREQDHRQGVPGGGRGDLHLQVHGAARNGEHDRGERGVGRGIADGDAGRFGEWCAHEDRWLGGRGTDRRWSRGLWIAAAGSFQDRRRAPAPHVRSAGLPAYSSRTADLCLTCPDHAPHDPDPESPIMSLTESLAERLVRYTDLRRSSGNLHPTEVDALTVARLDHPVAPVPTVYEPSICVVVQGEKRVGVGDTVLEVTAGDRLVVGVDVPATGRFVAASPEVPALSLILTLDAALLLDVAEAAGVTRANATRSTRPDLGLAVAPLSTPAAEALVRMVDLLDRPAAIPALYPAVARELYYWLLTGPGGDQFARVTLPSGHAAHVAEAIHQMRAAFPEPVNVADIATEIGMSVSAFYAHFKSVTGIAPLQYYKRLRLLDAQRLLTTRGAGVGEAAFAVGYQSASQFSREYARAFGVPPGQHAARERRGSASSARLGAAL